MSTDPTEVTQTETPDPETQTQQAPTQEQPPVSEAAPAETPVAAESTPAEHPAESTPVANEQITNDRIPKCRDIVDFVLSEGNNIGEKRPAIILKVWGDKPDSLVNLQVFTDGYNDFITAHPAAAGTWWRTSVERDDSGEKLGTYNFGE